MSRLPWKRVRAGMVKIAICLPAYFSGAPALRAQTSPDPNDILSRARVKIIEAMQRLPKYTCIQTIDRSYFTRPNANVTSIDSCDEASSEKRRRASPRLDATDRVRLEVAEGDAREIYSWPGASHFETGLIDQLISRGPAASGAFGGYLIDIFATKGVEFDFSGERSESGRSIFSYAYRVAQALSRYRVRTDDGWAITAYDGTFDIDAGSLALLRITVKTPELPRETDLCEARSSLEYARVRIGDGDFLLPRISELHLVNRGTLETNSTSVFKDCREYRAESVLHVEGDDEVSNSGATAGARVRGALPAGVRLTLRLNAPIDTDIAAAGDAVTATVTNAVRDPKSGAILFRAGAMAHGRISRMEHWIAAPSRFVIGIQWDSIGTSQESAPLSAIMDRSGQLNLGPMVGRGGGSGLARRPPSLGPPDAFTFPSGGKRYVIPGRYQTQWVTVAPPKESPANSPRQ